MTTEAPTPSPRRRLRLSRRVVTSAMLLAVILGLVALYRWRPVVAKAHTAERGTLTCEAFGRGTVESEREAELGFDLVGRVSDVLVDEGARVTLGQELARLAPEQVEADLKSAATGVSAARASLKRLAAEEQRAKAALQAADREEQRSLGLVRDGALAKSELDAAQDRVRLARADMDRVLAQRVEATRAIDLASGGAEQRRVTVRRATLLAPFDGLISRRFRDPGDTVTVGSTVLRLVDTGQLYVRLWIDESVLSRVQVGQRVRLLPAGSERFVAGRVARVGWESDRQTHEVAIDVAPTEALGRVAIGQRIDGWIETETVPSAVVIPIELVQRNGDGPFAFVSRSGRVDEVSLGLGRVGREGIEIERGLGEGDVILSAPKPGATLAKGRRWRQP